MGEITELMNEVENHKLANAEIKNDILHIRNQNDEKVKKLESDIQNRDQQIQDYSQQLRLLTEKFKAAKKLLKMKHVCNLIHINSQ